MGRVTLFIVGAAALGFGGWMAWKSVKAGDSKGWPVVTGTVEGHDTESFSRRRRPTQYEGRPLYEYEVDGVTHHGTRLAFTGASGLRRLSTRDEALTDARQRWPMGSAIEVHYDPESPEECTLKLSEPEWIVPSICGVVGLGCLGYVGMQTLSNRRRT